MGAGVHVARAAVRQRVQRVLPLRDRDHARQRLRQRQLHRGRAELQRVSAEVQDSLGSQPADGLVEESDVLQLLLVPEPEFSCAKTSGGDQDYDHPKLTKVLPHRITIEDSS